MGFKETYVQYSDARVKDELEEIRQLLFNVIDGTADMKEVSDTLVNLDVVQEFYTTMSDTVKAYDACDDVSNVIVS
tara:strand:- start:290 stop:517 length:228 start_codon:yes stop_codon:yes gene_type:complete